MSKLKLKLILWYVKTYILERDRLEKMQRGIFPFGNKLVPRDIVCCDCFGPGWGPMLRSKVWERIKPEVSVFEFIPKGVALPVVYPRKYLCEPCIEKRLGHPIKSEELRDCLMNIGHRLYEPHGLE